MFLVDPTIHMMFVFGVIFLALTSYAIEKIPLELTSLLVIISLITFFYIFPVIDQSGEYTLTPKKLLEGFANPALITVLCFLVIGQGLVQTGAIDYLAKFAFLLGGKNQAFSFIPIYILIILLSGIMNNTPVVVLFIPIMQALAKKFNKSASGVMIPLSYAAILGGMVTIIGSSSNLLVSGTLNQLGERSLSFFEFTIPGLIIASVGCLYVFLIAPRLLQDRASLASSFVGRENKQFIAQITVTSKSKLIGEQPVGGFFPLLKDITLFMIQRGEHAEIPPFEDITIQEGDILIVGATREVLLDTLKADPGLTYAMEDFDEGEEKKEQFLIEAMIAPGSRMVGLNLEQLGFRQQFNSIVLGLQRKSRMIRAKITEIRLEAGDVLLIQTSRKNIKKLRSNSDLLLIEDTATNLPTRFHSRRAMLIFSAVIAAAATGIAPIIVTSMLGAVAMLATQVLNIRQASRAIDRRIIMLIAASLAMGPALQETGGAAFIAETIFSLFNTQNPAVILSIFFIIIAVLTNVLSNNACAVLFTPIAIELSTTLNVSVIPFAVAVIFACNCSFASPIGYQTNLLVMAPGHYKFSDYMKAGIPLIIIIWILFSLIVPWYYNL